MKTLLIGFTCLSIGSGIMFGTAYLLAISPDWFKSSVLALLLSILILLASFIIGKMVREIFKDRK